MRRCNVEICYEMLRALEERGPIGPTRTLQLCNLNQTDCLVFIEKLMGLGYVELVSCVKKRPKYGCTGEGSKMGRRIKQLYGELGLELPRMF